jgi:hypothetical protein
MKEHLVEGCSIAPFYLFDVDNHEELKPQLLEAIASMGEHGMKDHSQSIANSDWQLPREFNRPYFYKALPTMRNVVDKIAAIWHMPNEINIFNYWFQQYRNGDYHGWHVHPDALFSCVYYLDMVDNNPRTTFNIKGKEISFPVKEGQILVFPAFLPHISKENKSDKMKTVIVFNIH